MRTKTVLAALLLTILSGAANAIGFTTCGAVVSQYIYSYRCYSSYNATDHLSYDYLISDCDSTSAHWLNNPQYVVSPIPAGSHTEPKSVNGCFEGQVQWRNLGTFHNYVTGQWSGVNSPLDTRNSTCLQ
jgi:hypothetical protein